VAQIERAVRQAVDILGANGGLILSALIFRGKRRTPALCT
jgi:hypothetical protein